MASLLFLVCAAVLWLPGFLASVLRSCLVSFSRAAGLGERGVSSVILPAGLHSGLCEVAGCFMPANRHGGQARDMISEKGRLDENCMIFRSWGSFGLEAFFPHRYTEGKRVVGARGLPRAGPSARMEVFLCRMRSGIMVA